MHNEDGLCLVSAKASSISLSKLFRADVCTQPTASMPSLCWGAMRLPAPTSQLQLLHESGLQMLMLMLMLVLMLAGHFSPFGHGQLVPGELLA